VGLQYRMFGWAAGWVLKRLLFSGRLFDSMTRRLMLGEALGSHPSRDLYEPSSPERLIMRLFLRAKLLKVTPRNGYFLRLHRSLSNGIPRKHMITAKLGCLQRKCRSVRLAQGTSAGLISFFFKLVYGQQNRKPSKLSHLHCELLLVRRNRTTV
jgi:hypothetical protein